jgi:hypothetical protein
MTPRSITTPLVLTAALSAAASAHAGVVTDWNRAALDAIRATRAAPPQASRALATLHVAIYDAIDGITRSHERYFVRSDVPASTSVDAAASAAARAVLVALFPSEATSFDSAHSPRVIKGGVRSSTPSPAHRIRGITRDGRRTGVGHRMSHVEEQSSI